MPHKCTRCESIFKDGAAILLNGCPHCGWNKFLYVKELEKQDVQEQKKEQEQEQKTQPEQKSDGIEAIPPVMPEAAETKPENKHEESSERVESVRIISPGTYELNLESLLERNEIVMALNGTYIVHLPSTFRKKKHQDV